MPLKDSAAVVLGSLAEDVIDAFHFTRDFHWINVQNVDVTWRAPITNSVTSTLDNAAAYLESMGQYVTVALTTTTTLAIRMVVFLVSVTEQDQ